MQLDEGKNCIVPSDDARPGCMVCANNFEPLVDPDSWRPYNLEDRYYRPRRRQKLLP